MKLVRMSSFFALCLLCMVGVYGCDSSKETEQIERDLYYDIEKAENETITLLDEIMDAVDDDPFGFLYQDKGLEYLDDIDRIRTSVEAIKAPEHLEEQTEKYKTSLLSVLDSLEFTSKDITKAGEMDYDVNIDFEKKKLYEMFEVYVPEDMKTEEAK